MDNYLHTPKVNKNYLIPQKNDMLFGIILDFRSKKGKILITIQYKLYKYAYKSDVAQSLQRVNLHVFLLIPNLRRIV